MGYNIYLEDLVSNAFICYLMKTGKRVLSIKKIELYGNRVAESLRKEGIDARLILRREYTQEFLFNYSAWFSLREEEFVLNNDVSTEILIENFIGYLPLPMLIAFRKEENIKALL